jgi:hypothetical protein
MKELFDAAFSAVNIIPTVLLLLILFYWIFVIIGAMDVDTISVDVDTDLDIDVDTDVEVDVDSDIDTDTEVDSHGVGSVAFLNSILAFFNLGKMPFMVWLSFVVIPMWVISILFNHYLGNNSILLSLAVLIPNLIVSLLISKVLTTPIAIAFRKMSESEEDNFSYKGKMCEIMMPVSNTRFGQAEINRDGTIYRINVLTRQEDVQLEKGDTALIIEYMKEKKCYIVEPYKI